MKVKLISFQEDTLEVAIIQQRAARVCNKIGKATSCAKNKGVPKLSSYTC